MERLSLKKKILGTVELVVAAAVIITAVVLAPNLFEDKAVSEPETQQTAETEVITDAPQETTETTTEKTGGAQPIGDYSVEGYIVVSEDTAMEMYSIAKTKLTEYAQTVNALSEKVPQSSVYVLLAPTRIEFYGPEAYRTGSHSQEQGIKIAYDALSPFVSGIDAYSHLSRHTEEYLYFRTDHHWTARGAFYAYQAFCEATGRNYASLDSYETGRMDGFVGSMYRYTQSEALKNNPDYVEYFLPKGETKGEFYSSAAMDDGKPLKIISTNISDASSKYLAFIQGDKPLIKMTSDCGSGKSILMIKESYGNALAPFLLENYSTVYVLDPRQASVQSMNLPQFIKDNGIQDVLFCNYTMVPSNSKYMKALREMIDR